MSDGHLEPKTIEDYRDIVKILKLKVMKQMKRIQELEEKVRTYQSQDMKSYAKDVRFQHQAAAKDSPVSKDFDYNNLKNKSIVMYLFQKGARKLGINLEGIFRYADLGYKNQIDSDAFRSLLSKMNLGLTLKQVSCLIFIFDEDCTGVITKNEYYNSLEAYQVSDQQSSRTFTQQCLMKLSQLFEQKKIDGSNFYEEFSRGQSKLDLNTFEEAIKKKIGKTLQDRQIIGSFNQIDFESQGYVEKNNFIYSLRAYISKVKTVLADSRMAPDGSTRKGLGDSNLKTKQSGFGLKTPTPKGPTDLSNSRLKESVRPTVTIREQKVIDGYKPNDQIPPQSGKSGALTLQEVLQDLARQKLSLKSLYPHLLQLNFDRPITLQMFCKIVKQQADGLKQPTISHLFKLIDRDQRGTIHFSQLLEFFIRVDGDTDTIFRILARSFQLDGLNTMKFFFTNQLEENDEVNQKQFKKILSNRFGIQQELFTNLWKYFDKKDTDRVHELSTYEDQ